MKKPLFYILCLAAMLALGTSLKTQETTITLAPGGTWSCPVTEAQSFATGLGDFTPKNGDIIKSQNGQARYRNGAWSGNITQFIPGYGYMYKSTRTEPVPLVCQAFTPAAQVTVTTSEPTEGAGSSVLCSGTVAVSDDIYIIARGFCWATHENPTTSFDSFQEQGVGVGNFSLAIIGQNPCTTYYVRAYAVTCNGTTYGDQKTFTTTHGDVDLDLPSGTLWATCNVGANSPEEYGNYFAWGETQPKTTYNWGTYQYSNGNNTTSLTKYCTNSSYGYNGFTDNLTTLLPEDDAATANWGEGWRMPTNTEVQELFDNTTATWTTQNGVRGRKFTASNGNSIFVPAAGWYEETSRFEVTNYGYIWSSTLRTEMPFIGIAFYFYSDDYGPVYVGGRHWGRSVRAVRSSQN